MKILKTISLCMFILYPADRRRGILGLLGAVGLMLTFAGPAGADGGVTFTDIAAGGGAGLVYERFSSPDLQAIVDAIQADNVFDFPGELFATPNKTGGGPGVAIFDYDGDGDLDIYVANTQGHANSLFSNQLVESNTLTFVDMAAAAGVAATAQDSQGVCFGDIDNDGDDDLYVVGRDSTSPSTNLMFENQGDGTFDDITATSGLGADFRTPSGCSMGDVNLDGLLDIVVGNSFDWSSQLPIFVIPFAANEHNQLFLNTGGNVFADVSVASGINELDFPPHASLPLNPASITWAVALVDYDLDGDIDFLHADDQGAMPTTSQFPASPFPDRGFIHIFQNDGTGHFTDIIEETGQFRFGAWMGFGFADFNCDGNMDNAVSNVGDYLFPTLGSPYTIGEESSRWYLGQGDGTFSDPGVGGLVGTPFAWGNAPIDYDNDGDTDIVFYGGLEFGLAILADNPGAILQNQGCSANFVRDAVANAATGHTLRNPQGVAMGDLNQDGFLDIVSVANVDIKAGAPVCFPPPPAGGAFDDTALFCFQAAPNATSPAGPGPMTPIFDILKNGSLTVEINSGGNGNRSTEVTLRGSIGDVPHATVNRSGIGGVIKFTPEGGQTAMRPVMGGSSHASAHSLAATFGLGPEARKGVVEVLWPGGVRNRLHGVTDGETVLFPEIPCSIDTPDNIIVYKKCVNKALQSLKKAGVISSQQRLRFLSSAILAFAEEHS